VERCRDGKTAALSLKTLSQSVSTNEIELWKRNLTGGYVYIAAAGSR